MNRAIKTFLLGLCAGASICLGATLSILCSSFIPNGKILGSFLFPIGLILICFFSFNLYTGKIGFLFNVKDKKNYLIDLFTMLLGNLLICFILGLLLSFLFKKNSTISSFLSSLYNNKTSISPLRCLINSVFCGLFVYSAVFSFKKLHHSLLKTLGILISIALFCLMGFDHCIANTFYFFVSGNLNNPTTYLYIFISIIGNSLGSLGINFLIN